MTNIIDETIMGKMPQTQIKVVDSLKTVIIETSHNRVGLTAEEACFIAAALIDATARLECTDQEKSGDKNGISAAQRTRK